MRRPSAQGFIWDDDDYVTENPLLSEPDGLSRIWLSMDAPSQYFPMVYTMLRVEFGLWGLDPLGYHLVNVLLHAANALLLWQLLRRLDIGMEVAWFAAAIFALHPVHVESVAWIAERKNLLSFFFALASLLAWLRHLERPGSFARPRLSDIRPALCAGTSEQGDGLHSAGRHAAAGLAARRRDQPSPTDRSVPIRRAGHLDGPAGGDLGTTPYRHRGERSSSLRSNRSWWHRERCGSTWASWSGRRSSLSATPASRSIRAIRFSTSGCSPGCSCSCHSGATGSESAELRSSRRSTLRLGSLARTRIHSSLHILVHLRGRSLSIHGQRRPIALFIAGSVHALRRGASSTRESSGRQGWGCSWCWAPWSSNRVGSTRIVKRCGETPSRSTRARGWPTSTSAELCWPKLASRSRFPPMRRRSGYGPRRTAHTSALPKRWPASVVSRKVAAISKRRSRSSPKCRAYTASWQTWPGDAESTKWPSVTIGPRSSSTRKTRRLTSCMGAASRCSSVRRKPGCSSSAYWRSSRVTPAPGARSREVQGGVRSPRHRH